MSMLPIAQEARTPRHREAGWVATVYAGVIVLIVVAQLFRFEDFHSVIASYWLPVSAPATHLIAALIVTAEVFSLPFLLRMRLSPAMRWFSMFLGWLAALWWLFISIWLLVTVNAVENSGLLGDTVTVRPGGWLVGLATIMAVLAAVSAWGLWPGITKGKSKK